MKVAGIILVVLGVLGFVFGGFSFFTTEKVADIGPIEIQKEERRSFPVTPLASGAALVAGLALVVIGARKSS